MLGRDGEFQVSWYPPCIRRKTQEYVYSVFCGINPHGTWAAWIPLPSYELMKMVKDWHCDWLYQGCWVFCGWFRRLLLCIHVSLGAVYSTRRYLHRFSLSTLHVHLRTQLQPSNIVSTGYSVHAAFLEVGTEGTLPTFTSILSSYRPQSVPRYF